MSETYLLILIIFFLSIIQTISGVGILLLGTPILLILNYQMIDVMTYLLPLSILTSILSYAVELLKSKKILFKYHNEMSKKFFIFCIPSIFIGLYILKKFELSLNFNILVSLTIILSIIIKKIDEKKKIILNDFGKKIIYILIGIIHGITNSGGALLSIFLLSENQDQKTITRNQIIFFYFFLAINQLVIIFLIFNLNIIYLNEILFKNLPALIIGVIVGNLFVKRINDVIFRNIIYFLSAITALILIS